MNSENPQSIPTSPGRFAGKTHDEVAEEVTRLFRLALIRGVNKEQAMEAAQLQADAVTIEPIAAQPAANETMFTALQESLATLSAAPVGIKKIVVKPRRTRDVKLKSARHSSLRGMIIKRNTVELIARTSTKRKYQVDDEAQDVAAMPPARLVASTE